MPKTPFLLSFFFYHQKTCPSLHEADRALHRMENSSARLRQALDHRLRLAPASGRLWSCSKPRNRRPPYVVAVRPALARSPPSARRCRASSCCCCVKDGGRPMCLPRAFARFLPSAVRALIKSRSTSASSPRTASIKRPILVPVSARGSARDRNCSPASVICLTIANRSNVGRARRQSASPSPTSPASILRSIRPSSRRSARAPLAFSR